MAMENGSLSPADISALTGNGGMGGNSFFWVFALLLLGMNGGFGWGNSGLANAIGYENLATSNEVQRGFDNQNAMANQREILAAVNAGTAQSVATTNQTFHDSLMANQNLYNEIARDIGNVQLAQANALANQNECCCNTKQLIQEVNAATNANIAQSKYDTSMQMAQMEQKILSKLDADKIESLQAQVNQLQLAQATAGMLKFPNQWTYNGGFFPPIYGCCGQNNI